MKLNFKKSAMPYQNNYRYTPFELKTLFALIYNYYLLVIIFLNVSFNLGCSKVGVYGTLCNQQCPTYCRDNKCNILNGSCYGCLTGWMGVTCNSSENTAIGIFITAGNCISML